jgi:O-antigen ligase
MIRWVAYGFIVVSLAAAVLLDGGAHPQQWQWSALGLSIGATLALLSRTERDWSSQQDWGVVCLAFLAAWMVIQWLPLPGWALQRLSPDHWRAVVAARAAAGLDAGGWAALSLAPAATLERLLNVIPALAAFLTARQMAWWWRDRIWIVVAPVVAIAWPESVLGMAQFYFARIAHGQSDPATGTYVYHNHFAGLLEMAFPLAVLWAVWSFRQGATPHHPEKLGPALKAAALFGIAACLLGGIVTSLSRMGFISVMAATGLTGMAVMVARSSGPRHERQRNQRQRWVWATALALPLLILLLVLPPNELIARFGEITTEPDMTIDARADIWGNTMREVAASPWTGVGLGAYEHGLYRFKTTAPTSTVDFAHNDYLQVLAELGIPGAALVGAVAAWILFRCSYVVLMRRSPNWELAVGLFGSLVTLGLHSLADFNLYSPANALALAWLAGVAVSPGLREC